MTHSHDRTLLASLGFADPDKREPLHDLACEYLAEPAQSERMVQLVRPGSGLSIKSRTEVLISKGEGPYRTTVGFLDVRIDWWSDVPTSGEESFDVYDSEQRAWRTEIEKWNVWHRGSVFVEVKIKPVGVGDMLRQIALYSQHARAAEGRSTSEQIPKHYSLFKDWVIATAFDLDAGQTETLRREKIYPIRLSDGFTKWFEERQKRSAPKIEHF